MEYRLPLPRTDSTFHALVKNIKPEKIIEFGTWEGRSCISFLLASKELGINTKILCVDTWLGSYEHWENLLPNSEWSFHHLRVENGEPQVIQTFRSTIKKYGFDDQVTILRCQSENSGKYLADYHYDAQLIYIDARHDFRGVYKDIKIARKSFASIQISGDDFFWIPIKFAVILTSLISQRTILIGQNNSTWLLIKRDKVLESKFKIDGWMKVNVVILSVETCFKYMLFLIFQTLRSIAKLKSAQRKCKS